MKRSPVGSGSAGYTVVELMMAMAVMAIGITGVISMQKVTVVGNQQAKNIALATHIAQAWLDELAAEASQWNGTNDFDETVWLAQVGAEDQISDWFRPDYDAARNFGPAFDALGSPVASANFASDAHFCSDLRLTWLQSQNNIKRGGGLIRAQVRVYWRREGTVGLSEAIPKHACDISLEDFDGDDGPILYHSVYLSTALRQHGGDE